jgi:hypothetical protein
MESWRKVWRDGFSPGLSSRGLQALRSALVGDDGRLLQGATTSPPPMAAVQDWPIEACCAIGFCGWQGEGLSTVGQVEEYFARACMECDTRLEEPAACRYFLNFFDETPRDEMRRLLVEEINRELAERAAV